MSRAFVAPVGAFSAALISDGEPRSDVARLDADGSLDPTFFLRIPQETGSLSKADSNRPSGTRR